MPEDRDSLTLLPSEQRPTSVRYLVVGLATLMAVLLYLDRYCLSFLVRFLTEDFALDPLQQGTLLSVFFLSYALGQVPSGWLTDRYGARLMLTLYIVVWSLCTGLMGLVWSLALILLLRLGCGLGQAGAYPTGASMISKWMPLAARGSASGIVSVGGRLGGFLAPVLTAYLLITFVPITVPSEFTDADILRPEALLKALQSKGGTAAEQAARAIRELAPNALAQVEKSASNAQTALLVTLLNDVITRPEFYHKVDLNQFDLPAEAWNLTELPDEDLTADQVARRNRLLLEAAFPDDLRKIYGQGWRPVVIVYGLIGLGVALAFWLGVRDRPRQHPGCNAAEIDLIEEGRRPLQRGGRVGRLPLRQLVHSRNMWLSSISQFGTNFGWSFLVLLLPTYLDEVHHLPPLQRGWLSSLPVLVGMAGMVAGGWLTDGLTQALGVRWGRGLPMALTRFVAMAAYLACLFLDSPWLLTVAFCGVAVATDLGTASVWAFNQDVGGRHVGSVLGWGNMWGNFGAGVSPLVLTRILGPDRWTYRFLACALAFLISGICALGVDARVPVAPEED